jgi:hypothetical protein
MAHETLRTAELSIVVGDNEVGIGEHAGHRPGYNGVWCLTSVHAPENCFVPSLSGLNLEHLMDDLFMTEAGGEIFEPRQHPMTLQRLSDTSVRLLQQASPLTGVASVTTFTVREPHAVDMTFEATLTEPPRAGRAFGFFLGQLYQRAGVTGAAVSRCRWHLVLSEPGWPRGWQRQYGVPRLGRPHLGRSRAALQRPQPGALLQQATLPTTVDVRTTRRRLHAISADVRPAGAAAVVHVSLRRRSQSRKAPAQPGWDFQYILEQAPAGTRCSLRTRVVYKPFVDRDEIEHLHAQWLTELG